jgi:putative oxidoreductase
MKALQWINKTPVSIDLSLLVARLVLSIVVAGHGAQKLFGWFHGYGFEGAMQFFTETIGLPYLFGVLIILTETLGMLLLFAGYFTRLFASGVVMIMLGAIFTYHAPNGFFMNWDGNLPGEGYEFHLLATALAATLSISGGGKFSLDYFFTKRSV